MSALYVPEFFESDIGGKTAFGNVIIKHFQTDAVGNDGGLADCNVGERTGMHHAGLVLDRTHQRRIDGIAHPGRHGTADFQISGGYGIAAFIKGNRDLVQSFSQIRQIPGDGQDGHAFGIRRRYRTSRTW